MTQAHFSGVRWLRAQSASQGWMLCCGVMTTAALPVVLVLTYAPRWVGHVCWSSLVLTAAGIG